MNEFSKEEIQAFFIEKGRNNLTWKELGLKFGKTGNAVRHIYRKLKKENKLKLQLVQPKILILDIENSPAKSYHWGLWNQNISPTNGQLVQDQFIICWSAKWLFGEKVLNACQTPKEAIKQDDKRIVEELWKLMEEADVIIGHNVKAFDIKKINTRFLIHDLPPTSSYLAVDTLLEARKYFKFMSNKLDYLGMRLLDQRKLETGGMKLWINCMNGEQDSLTKMQVYCDKDILVTEDLFLKLRKWIKSLPNFNLFQDTQNNCPNCGSGKLSQIKDYVTKNNSYKGYRCECGAISRGEKVSKKVNLK